MTHFLTSQYWIAQNAITFVLNAMGDPQKVSVSISSGAVVMAYMPGVEGLGYDNSHSYRRWRLRGYASILQEAVVTHEATGMVSVGVGQEHMVDGCGRERAFAHVDHKVQFGKLQIGRKPGNGKSVDGGAGCFQVDLLEGVMDVLVFAGHANYFFLAAFLSLSWATRKSKSSQVMASIWLPMATLRVLALPFFSGIRKQKS